MNARQKLNEHAIWTAIGAATLIGWLTSSWIVFVLVSGGLIASAIAKSEIRLGQNKEVDVEGSDSLPHQQLLVLFLAIGDF